jgi:hypothetical protein
MYISMTFLHLALCSIMVPVLPKLQPQMLQSSAPVTFERLGGFADEDDLSESG